MAKRGYKLQEFVAHASNVNCLNIGRKSSRLLVTGGEDQKVNLWAIGRPTSLLSLSGHTSPVESVIFDSAEVLVLSGASFGVIKLWDLEEAKVVRTLTGHRSSCNALQFHPFGEFFASGSSDTSLKIWDVRKKGCIHTYKGHTRGVSTIRFSPDGRWVVSGGADNIVKIWDLTAGKLLHEFKFHEGQIQCIDFHPLEFLLATGSADKTLKFWDLETFEMIGSAGPEATEVRSMTFHPDGKTLFCGLEDSLKVFSWEPIICHDSVDMGWSTLGDLNINEGKLLGCSYYHNCVGVWAADINLFGPYVAGVPPQSTGHLQQKFDTQANHALQKVGNVMKSSSRFTTTPEDDETPEIRNIYMDTSGSNKIIPERMGINSSTVVPPLDSPETNGPSTLKRIPQIQAHLKSSGQSNNTKSNVPVVVPRNNSENLANFGSEVTTRENTAPGMVVKPTHVRRESNGKYEIEKLVTNEAGRDSDKVGVPKLSLDRDSYVMLPSKVESTEIGGNPTYPRREPNDKYETEKLSVSNVPGRYVNKVGGSNISPSENFRSRIRSKVDSTVKVKEDNDKDVKNVAERFERVLSSDDLSTSRRYSSKVDSTLTVKEDSHKDIKNVSERFERVLSSDNLSTSRRHSSKVDSTVTLKEDSYKDIKNVTERFERVLSSNDLLSSKSDNGVESHCPGSEISSTQKVNKVQLGRTRSLVERFEKRVKSSSDLTSLDTTSTKLLPETPAPPHMSKEQPQTSGRESTYMDDEYVLEDLMRSSGAFISSFQSRLAKLQVVRYFWQRNDVKGGLNAVGKLPDHYVQADVVSVLIEKMDIVSLELFSLLLPMLLGLLNSQIDRHTHISLEMLLKLVAIFGPVIRSTVSASPSIGVDLHAEKRREWCSQCLTQLQKIKQIIPSVTRRGGILEKYAHELNLLLQES